MNHVVKGIGIREPIAYICLNKVEVGLIPIDNIPPLCHLSIPCQYVYNLAAFL